MVWSFGVVGRWFEELSYSWGYLGAMVRTTEARRGKGQGNSFWDCYSGKPKKYQQPKATEFACYSLKSNYQMQCPLS